MSYLISPDVTNPQATVKLVDPATGLAVKTILGGIEFATIELADDGTARLIDGAGNQLEQYPGLPACFSWVPGRGAYGRCTIAGVLVSFKPRAEDPVFVYTLMKVASA
jgi:hypothetical protein